MMNETYGFKEVNVRLCLKEGNTLYSQREICTPKDAVSIMKEVLIEMDQEVALVVNVDTKGKPINFSMVSMGDIDRSLISVRNVYKSAILSNANSIILFHNHPSGDTQPSFEDFNVTNRIVEAGKLLGITLLDHIIVGAFDGREYSFRTNNPDMFENQIREKVLESLLADLEVEEDEEMEM